MSQDGWRAFLDADGVDDGVILDGGPTAVFRVGSLQKAARLAAEVADVAGVESRTLLTLASDRLTVKLTREMWGTEARHIDVARAISALARKHGAAADRRAVQEVQLAIAAKPEAIDLGFWRAVLGYAGLHDDNCVDPLGQGSTVWMQDLDPAKPLKARHARRRLRRSRGGRGTDGGGRRGRWAAVDDSGAPGAWTLADRSGRCVSPPGLMARPSAIREPRADSRHPRVATPVMINDNDLSTATARST